MRGLEKDGIRYIFESLVNGRRLYAAVPALTAAPCGACTLSVVVGCYSDDILLKVPCVPKQFSSSFSYSTCTHDFGAATHNERRFQFRLFNRLFRVLRVSWVNRR